MKSFAVSYPVTRAAAYAAGNALRAGRAVPAIRLSANSLQENSAQNTAIGTLFVSNATGTAVFTLTDSAGNKVQLAGTNNVNVQAGAVASNFETAQSYSFTVSVSGVTPAIAPTTFQINVVNVFEVTLSALTLNTSTITEGSAEDTSVGTLQSTSAGSTLSLVDSAGNRFKLSGSNIVAGPVATNYSSATSHNITVRETHADASNSPRDSVIAITVAQISSVTDDDWAAWVAAA